jgi:hypothetical protein
LQTFRQFFAFQRGNVRKALVALQFFADRQRVALASKNRSTVERDRPESPLRTLLNGWDHKTLADLKAEADKELNGTALESLRVNNGPRGFVVICATGEHQISLIEKIFDFQDDGPHCDWNTTTLFRLTVDTERENGMSYQELREPMNNRTAVILCATRPEKIRILETIFSLAP